MHVGGVGADHCKDHQREENAHHADREKLADGDGHEHLFLQRLSCGHAVGLDALGEFGLHRGGLLGEVRVVHVGVGGERQQHEHEPLEACFPGAEHACHFLFVGVEGGGVVALRALPRHAVVDAGDEADDDEEEVEVLQLGGIEGIDK